jgi:hypothetical protein
MPPEARNGVLQEVGRAAARVLCVDFRAPMPRNLAGWRNRLAELAAGPEHYRAYRDFTRRGGIPGIAASAGVRCRHRRFTDNGTLQICELVRPSVQSRGRSAGIKNGSLSRAPDRASAPHRRRARRLNV